MPIEIGLRLTRHEHIEPQMSAEHWGNAGVDVLATPHLVGLFELAAFHLLQPHLEPGQASVGTAVNIRHVQATPIGDTMQVTAEIVAIDGRRLTFQVTAEDSYGLAGEGTHERTVVDRQRFLERLASRR